MGGAAGGAVVGSLVNDRWEGTVGGLVELSVIVIRERISANMRT